MKIKSTKCEKEYKLKLSHKELSLIWYALNFMTFEHKKKAGLTDINNLLFDKDEFKSIEEWDDVETEIWNEIDEELGNTIVY